MVISSDPDLYASSTKYNDAVLGVDSPHPLLSKSVQLVGHLSCSQLGRTFLFTTTMSES